MTLLVIFHHHYHAITASFLIDKAPECFQTYLAGVPYLRTITGPHKTRISRIYGNELLIGETTLPSQHNCQDLCHQREDTRNEVAAELSYMNMV